MNDSLSTHGVFTEGSHREGKGREGKWKNGAELPSMTSGGGLAGLMDGGFAGMRGVS